MPHSIIHGDAYFAYFNKIWGIPIAVFDFGYRDKGYKLEYCDVVIALHMKTIPVTVKGRTYYLATSGWNLTLGAPV